MVPAKSVCTIQQSTAYERHISSNNQRSQWSWQGALAAAPFKLVSPCLDIESSQTVEFFGLQMTVYREAVELLSSTSLVIANYMQLFWLLPPASVDLSVSKLLTCCCHDNRRATKASHA